MKNETWSMRKFAMPSNDYISHSVWRKNMKKLTPAPTISLPISSWWKLKSFSANCMCAAPKAPSWLMSRISIAIQKANQELTRLGQGKGISSSFAQDGKRSNITGWSWACPALAFQKSHTYLPLYALPSGVVGVLNLLAYWQVEKDPMSRRNTTK